MSFLKSITKIIKGTSKIASPVSAVLRKQGGALGTVGTLMNPGAAVSENISAGAPITARTMLDPTGIVAPPPVTPTDGSAPPPVLPPLGQAILPPNLARRPTMYPQPPVGGAFNAQAFGMAGIPPSMQSGTPGPIPIGPPPQVTPFPPQIGLPSTPSGPSIMQTPEDILRMLRPM